jgi:hypothetical protein
MGGGLDTVFYNSPAGDFTPTFSPDGRWLAYTSRESGRDQVYVRPFPPQASGAVWQVSSDGGNEPVWSRSGRELFYREAGWLVAAELRTTPSFGIIARRRLFQSTQYSTNPFHPRYAALPGDREFLMLRGASSTSPSEAVVVLNWMSEVTGK